MANARKRPGKTVAAPRPVEAMIHVISGQKVMLDRDLAELYSVPTRTLNQSARRNLERFPPDFMFRLEPEEIENVNRSQIVTGCQRHPFTTIGFLLDCGYNCGYSVTWNLAGTNRSANGCWPSVG